VGETFIGVFDAEPVGEYWVDLRYAWCWYGGCCGIAVAVENWVAMLRMVESRAKIWRRSVKCYTAVECGEAVDADKSGTAVKVTKVRVGERCSQRPAGLELGTDAATAQQDRQAISANTAVQRSTLDGWLQGAMCGSS
jgi:hypothetical protein